MLSHCESHTARHSPPTDQHLLESGYEVGEHTLHHGDAQTYDNHRKQDMLYVNAFFFLSPSLPLSSLKYPCSPHCLYCIRLLCQPPIKFQASQTAKSISCGSGQEQSTAITILFSKNPFSKTNIQRPREIWVMKLLYLLSQTPGLITAGEGRR